MSRKIKDVLQRKRGTSLLDVVFGVAIFLIVFLGIFGVFRLSIELVVNSKAKVGALALAGEQMEFIRSLSYDDVGTVGGIPPGNIVQEEAISLNATSYTRRTFIQYIDAPQDGLGGADMNSITADYKVVKVEMLWSIRDRQQTLSLVSNIVPKGMESLGSGGVLTVNVFDALASPVSSAQATVVNDGTVPPIDVTTFTNVSGIVAFPGSPAASSYEVTVTKSGYSTSRTYDADVANPNPNPGHLSVIEDETTTSSFAIDLLSSKTVKTWKPIEQKEFEDLFPNDLNLSATTSTEVVGGEIRLFNDTMGYTATGSAFSIKIETQYLAGWKSVEWNENKPANTDIYYQVYYENSLSQIVLVSDADLPGNSIGFQVSPVNISGLNIASYPNIEVAGFLSTSDASSTPSVLDWKVIYDEGPIPLGDIPFSMRGDKTIGLDGSGSPIYKYSASHQTNSTGELNLNNLEWDNYTIEVDGASTGYDISESCLPQPRSIPPNVSTTTDIFLVPDTVHSIIVAVTDDSGAFLSGASVRLYRLPYDETQSTSACGQTFFNNLSQGTILLGNPYTIDASLAGYQSTTVIDVDVDGPSKISIILDTL